MIEVDTVPELLAHLRASRCRGCGGAYRGIHPARDRTSDRVGQHYVDTYTMVCTACGQPDRYVFRIDAMSPAYLLMARKTDALRFLISAFEPDHLGASGQELRPLLVQLLEDPTIRPIVAWDPGASPEARVTLLIDAITVLNGRVEPAVLEEAAREGPAAFVALAL